MTITMNREFWLWVLAFMMLIAGLMIGAHTGYNIGYQQCHTKLVEDVRSILDQCARQKE